MIAVTGKKEILHIVATTKNYYDSYGVKASADNKSQDDGCRNGVYFQFSERIHAGSNRTVRVFIRLSHSGLRTIIHSCIVFDIPNFVDLKAAFDSI